MIAALNFGNAVGVSIDEDEETIALQALNKFLESPHSIGLDTIKESLRNVVQLMMELKGYATGFSLQHLVHGEHSSMAVDGGLRDDAEKKRRIQEFWDEMMRLERLMAAGFEHVFAHVAAEIVEIKEDIADEIEAIDAQIEEAADTVEEARALKAKNTKRRKLIKFKKHIEEHEVELHEADTTEELIEVQSNVLEDVQDFKENRFDPYKNKLDILAPVRGIMESTRARNDHNYDNSYNVSHGLSLGSDYSFGEDDSDVNASASWQHKNSNAADSSDTGSGSGSASGAVGDDTSGSGDGGAGSGDKDGDVKPPPLELDY
ncbi:MAG: hypothetical protein COB14_04060 [Alphaproteobacteria bacterium]|nr:MAG: hypothetical protein COB14_04060 [Alphaproteobacteria bacterium]